MRTAVAFVGVFGAVSCVGGAPRAPEAASSRAERAERAEEPARPNETQRELAERYGDRRALGVMRGRASFYADALRGNPTASGDRYDPRAFTAAARRLPFGTVLRVTRPDTGASVLVRVNDRGPFGRRARILDLSRAAAEELDMIGSGVIQVRAEVLERPRD